MPLSQTFLFQYHMTKLPLCSSINSPKPAGAKKLFIPKTPIATNHQHPQIFHCSSSSSYNHNLGLSQQKTSLEISSQSTLFPSLLPLFPVGFHQETLMESSSGENGRLLSKELDVAVRVVQMACALCQRVQNGLVGGKGDQIKAKDDDSPVTVADWGVQATVSWMLSQNFSSENVSIVAEEDVQTLSKRDSASLLESVVSTVNDCLAEAPKYGLRAPRKSLGSREVLEAISRCNSTGGPKGRFWTLDPVDGTLGFVRGDQYAVALALIEDGQVILGVLGCPNYPMKKQWLNYHQRYFRLMSKLSPPAPGSWDKGCVFYAQRGSGQAWMQPLIPDYGKLEMESSRTLIRVSSIDDLALATFCEPVEKTNSSHSFTAGLAESVGMRKQPLRVYSMVKYAAIARGDAEIFMKFARAGYKEKIWDHAAGVVIIQEAGGVVTDARGHPLDFSRGIYLEGLDRGIIACSSSVLHQKIIGSVDASWDSSSL